MNNQPVSVALGAIAESQTIPHTYTLGVSDVREMKEKMEYAASKGFTLYKLKLDGIHDEEVLRNFRSLSDAPFAVDANQAWKKIDQALGLIDFLESNECVLIEQPFHKSDRELSFRLRESTVIPVIADEACQQFDDLFEVLDAFDGVNVKLQKCGGVTPTFQQLKEIRLRGKKALIGCMSESSVGCNAAENLTFLCDWADLDGPFLNANNEELCRQIGYSL
jgi:L-alanine-DL-glutamate epimerase-like enolase superfamily enzyme